VGFVVDLVRRCVHGGEGVGVQQPLPEICRGQVAGWWCPLARGGRILAPPFSQLLRPHKIRSNPRAIRLRVGQAGRLLALPLRDRADAELTAWPAELATVLARISRGLAADAELATWPAELTTGPARISRFFLAQDRSTLT
jgi:hypothetical protein